MAQPLLTRGALVLVVALAPGTVRAQATQGPPNGWLLGLRLGEAWDSNPQLQPAPASSSFVHRLGLSLGFQRAASRSSVSLYGTGSGISYQAAGTDDQLLYSFGTDAWLQASSRTRLALNHAQSETYSRNVPLLIDEGLPIQLTRAHTTATTASVTRQLGSLASLVASARRVAISFDDPTLIDGSVLSTEIRGERRIGPTDALSVAYAFQHSDRVAEGTDAHSLLLGWQGSLGARLRASVEAGLVHYPAAEASGIGTTGRGGLTLERQLDQGTISLGYSRLVTQSFGTGQDRLADLVSLSFAKTIHRDVSLKASSSYSYSRDPSDPAFRYETWISQASLLCQLSRSTSVEAAYDFSSRQPELNEGASGHAVSVQISSGWRWR